MSTSAYLGAGTTLSSSYYFRRFYETNQSARTSTTRKHLSNAALSNADAAALREAVKSLRSFSYDDDNSTNIRNNVSAFVDTYNNLLDSAADSTDRKITQTAKNIKSITNEYADQLDKLGVTVNADGTLEARSTLLSTAAISKFKKLFSADADYVQRISSYTKRIEHRSSMLYTEEQNAIRLKTEAEKNAADTPTPDIPVTDPAATSLEDLLNTGIGTNVNISL